jgi:hypothetical protein
MSKTSSSRLTASRQKARSEADHWLDRQDAMLNHCRTLDTLAELLANTGRNDVVKLEVVNKTGSLMVEEVACLKKLVSARTGRKEGR